MNGISFKIKDTIMIEYQVGLKMEGGLIAYF